MRREELPTTVHLAVLAEAAPPPYGRRVCGVLAYDDHGQRHYQPVTAEVAGPLDVTQGPASVARQLCLDLGEHSRPRPSSAGLTWWTWTLPSVPTRLRDRALAEVVDALAGELAEGSP